MENENLYYQIELTARKIRQFGQGILNQHGIELTVEQWLVLKVIMENDGINQVTIGEILVKDKPTISRMVKSLLAKELIQKESNTSDLREFTIALTSKGKKLTKKMVPIVEKIRLQGLENITAKEKSAVSQTLSKIRKNINP